LWNAAAAANDGASRSDVIAPHPEHLPMLIGMGPSSTSRKLVLLLLLCWEDLGVLLPCVYLDLSMTLRCIVIGNYMKFVYVKQVKMFTFIRHNLRQTNKQTNKQRPIETAKVKKIEKL